MKLKHQYTISMIGLALTMFGAGWLALSVSMGLPNLSTVNAIGFIISGLGLAIMIKTLSTIEKLDVIIDEVEDINDK